MLGTRKTKMMPIDYKKYPKNWLTEIRPRILKRANNTCEFDGCNFKNGEIVWSARLYDKKKTIWVRTKEEAIKKAIESGWSCEISYPIIKKVKVVLTIAHLDHDEENINVTDDRLKAACQICHLKYDSKEKSQITIQIENYTQNIPTGDIVAEQQNDPLTRIYLFIKVILSWFNIII